MSPCKENAYRGARPSVVWNLYADIMLSLNAIILNAVKNLGMCPTLHDVLGRTSPLQAECNSSGLQRSQQSSTCSRQLSPMSLRPDQVDSLSVEGNKDLSSHTPPLVGHRAVGKVAMGTKR